MTDRILSKKACLLVLSRRFCRLSIHPGCWHFDNVALSKIDDVLTEHGGLPHVLPLVVHLIFFWQTSRGDHSACLKVCRSWVGWVVVAPMILVWARVLLGLLWVLNWVWLGLGTKGSGPGLDNSEFRLSILCSLKVLLWTLMSHFIPSISRVTSLIWDSFKQAYRLQV